VTTAKGWSAADADQQHPPSTSSGTFGQRVEATAVILRQQLGDRRINDALDHASMRDAASHRPVAYCASQLQAGIQARAPDFVQLLLPIAFGDSARQLLA
jgi:hypothetical protein